VFDIASDNVRLQVNMALYIKAFGFGILSLFFVVFFNGNLAYARLPDFGLDYRIPAHFGNTDRINDPNSTCIHFDMPPWNMANYPGVGSMKIGIEVGDGTYNSWPSVSNGVQNCSLDAPGNITHEGSNFLTVYEFPNYVNPLGFVEISCTAPVLNTGDCVIVTPPTPPACTTHCFTDPISSTPNNLYYSIPTHFDVNGTTIYCDVPDYNNEYFGSYRIGVFPGDDLYFSSTTYGTGLCTGSVNAPGNILMPGVNYLTMYLDNNYTQPYGFIEFFCTEPVTSPGDCVIVPYSLPPATCTENCFSSVLFLPGMMGSRLYENEEELWVSISDSRQEKMSLDENGKSINDVYTKNDTQRIEGEGDETGVVDDVFSLNIYQSFIEDLEKWKTEDETIEDYAFIPYDWRLSLEDIITNGSVSGYNLSYRATQDFSESFILQKLRGLQESSRTNKVTIIAHSYGGLVAKALIEKLKETNDPLYNQIDKLILVAVPQIGTPESAMSILHGLDIGGGFVMSNNRSRQLSENMPTIYNLLPSDNYYNTVDPLFEADRLVRFQGHLLLQNQISEYGEEISNTTELKNYILGTDGRSKPSFENTLDPNIGNAYLYEQAEEVHGMLDHWQPPSDMKVIQVAGWGVETKSGLDYRVYPGLLPGEEYVSYVPRRVIDGDKTVVAPSALWMSPSNPNIERWWVDLLTYDTIINISRDHKDIFEVSNLRKFIEHEIKKVSGGSSFFDEDNIVVSNTPTFNLGGTRLHYILHSPLTLAVKDSQGNYTGLDPITGEIKQEIPDVIYEQIGEVQYLSVPEGLNHTLHMTGVEDGVFALDIEKQEGNEIVEKTSFQGIPSFTNTLANIDISANQELKNSVLEIDQDGNGTVDKTIEAEDDGITVYDTIPPEISITFSTSKKQVVFEGVDSSPVNIGHSSSSTKVIDSQGNISTLFYNIYKQKPTNLRLLFNKITRNNISTNLPSTYVEYSWKENRGKLTDLDTKLFIKGKEAYIFSYIKQKNVIIIWDRIGKKMKVTTKKGFVPVTLTTKSDSVEVNY